MTTNLAIILLTGALLASSQGQEQQTSPSPSATPPTALPPTASAEASVTVDGVLEQYLTNPDGQVDGIILADGTQVKLPSHISSKLTDLVKPKEKVRVQGQRGSSGVIKALNITNATSGKSLTEAQSSEAGPPPVASQAASRKPLQADGKIRFVLHAAGGETEGAVLENGTVLRIPPHIASRFESILQVGKDVSVKGEGSENQFGRSIEVKEIGVPGQKLTPIYETAPTETEPQP